MGTDNEHAPASERALAYLLTFHSYGTWLHGNPRGSTVRYRGKIGPDDELYELALETLTEPPMYLAYEHRVCCLDAMRVVCAHRGWDLLAANVRTNHVHLVTAGAHAPKKMIADLKSWATRLLIERGLVPQGRKVWTKGGDARWLLNEASVARACRYVRDGQGVDLGAVW